MQTNKNKKIAIYCRSSAESRENQESHIAGQIASLKEKYKEENIVKEYKDYGSTEDYLRPGFTQLSKDAETGLFNVVAVVGFDRLTRSHKESSSLLRKFRKLKIKVEVNGLEVSGISAGVISYLKLLDKMG